MKEKPKFKRRKLIVNPSLQHRLIRDVSSVPIIVLIAGMTIMAVSFRLMIQQALDADVLLPGIHGFLGCMAVFVFMACYVTLNMATRVSNRVAGPLYRLHKAMDQLTKGDTDCRVKFRDGDYLTETADVFNRLVDFLKEGLKEEWNPSSSGTADPEPDQKESAKKPADAVETEIRV